MEYKPPKVPEEMFEEFITPKSLLEVTQRVKTSLKKPIRDVKLLIKS